MKLFNRFLLVALVALCLVSLLGLSACFGSDEEEETQAASNRAYMSQVNQIMADLEEPLSSFNTAASADDLAGMKTAAASASKIIAGINSLEPTDDLTDVHEAYTEGCALLDEALQAYVALYTEIESTESDASDVSDYENRLTEIQALYNEGVEKLAEGDSLAAGKDS